MAQRLPSRFLLEDDVGRDQHRYRERPGSSTTVVSAPPDRQGVSNSAKCSPNGLTLLAFAFAGSGKRRRLGPAWTKVAPRPVTADSVKADNSLIDAQIHEGTNEIQRVVIAKGVLRSGFSTSLPGRADLTLVPARTSVDDRLVCEGPQVAVGEEDPGHVLRHEH